MALRFSLHIPANIPSNGTSPFLSVWLTALGHAEIMADMAWMAVSHRRSLEDLEELSLLFLELSLLLLLLVDEEEEEVTTT